MLNSHSSSLSLAGGRRACPALKPDAADQVLLKNRAGFAAFSKGRAFHRCREQDRCAGDREAGTGGAIRRRGDAFRRVAMPVAQDVSPRLIPLVVSLVPRILLGFSHYLRVSDPRAAGAPSGRDGRTGRASLQRGWWGHPAMRAYGWADGLRPWGHAGPLVAVCGGICPVGHISFNACALPLFPGACRVLNVLFAAFRLWAAV